MDRSTSSTPPNERASFKVISGGQTGVDRAALDAALELGLEIGGTCPKGRRAEDGRIPDRYSLIESESDRYPVRTEQNVLDADATLVLTTLPATGGTALTIRLAERHAKPLLVIDLPPHGEDVRLRRWIRDNEVRVLNVAGPRESQNPGIALMVERFLTAALRDFGSSRGRGPSP